MAAQLRGQLGAPDARLWSAQQEKGDPKLTHIREASHEMRGGVLEGMWMLTISDFDIARAKVQSDLKCIFEKLGAMTQGVSQLELDAGLLRLAQIRSEVYEELNQIQHEYAALCAVEWLASRNDAAGLAWHWNPRQTGDHTEPDVRATRDGMIVLSAEVTASASPKGTIDKRMHNTLAKLSLMDGRKFYFVRTEAMRRRAATKVGRNNFPVEVVLMELEPRSEGK
ncbi:hypothetical protein [Roseibium album]|uniref:hypothetical protein n=1 Tax=Roseibium album TaxID=311410 RepID=UPI00391D00D9